VWQAFCVLLPLRSAGVAGDAREYGYVLALRAVLSEDGMAADVFDFPMGDLLEIATKITNAVRGVGGLFMMSPRNPRLLLNGNKASAGVEVGESEKPGRGGRI